MEKNKLVHLSIIGIFVSLYFLVATISMINSVAFFDLAHSGLMNWALAIGFEIGAAASLAAIVILDKTNKTMVWGLFLLLTELTTAGTADTSGIPCLQVAKIIPSRIYKNGCDDGCS